MHSSPLRSRSSLSRSSAKKRRIVGAPCCFFAGCVGGEHRAGINFSEQAHHADRVQSTQRLCARVGVHPVGLIGQSNQPTGRGGQPGQWQRGLKCGGAGQPGRLHPAQFILGTPRSLCRLLSAYGVAQALNQAFGGQYL